VSGCVEDIAGSIERLMSACAAFVLDESDRLKRGAGTLAQPNACFPLIAK
jgi:hypothetical protein